LTSPRDVLTWLTENWKVWLDGLGVALILVLGGWLRRRLRRSPDAPTALSAAPRLSTGGTAEGSLVGTQNVGSGITAHTVNIHPPMPSVQREGAFSPPPESRQLALDGWEMLQAAVGEASALTSIMQYRPAFHYGGFDDMGDKRAMDGYGLTEKETAAVLEHSGENSRHRAFTRIWDWKRYRKVEDQLQAFFNHVIKSKWLLPEPVAEALLETGKSLRVAMIALKIGLENPETVNLEEQRRISDEKVRELQGAGMKDLERLLRSHYRQG
jgi:hypothetical protein